MTIMPNSDLKFHRHAEKIQNLMNSVLNSPGHSSSQLRRSVEQKAAAHAGRFPANSDPLPQELAGYVDKIALHAYKVTDEDIMALREAGYSEDAIFEVTISAALGAGMARLDRGIAAMKGER